MSFVFQKISDHGTDVPAVARGLPQASRILDATKLSKQGRDDVLAVVFELQRHLVRCLTERKEVEKGVVNGRKQLAAKGFGPHQPILCRVCLTSKRDARVFFTQPGWRFTNAEGLYR